MGPPWGRVKSLLIQARDAGGQGEAARGRRPGGKRLGDGRTAAPGERRGVPPVRAVRSLTRTEHGARQAFRPIHHPRAGIGRRAAISSREALTEAMG